MRKNKQIGIRSLNNYCPKNETNQKLFGGWKTLLFAVFLLGTQIVNAQFYGWPNFSGTLNPEEDAYTFNVYPTGTPPYAPTLVDGNKARVMSAVIKSGTVYTLQLESPVDLNTISFPANKWCILIQMEDPNSVGNTIGTNTRVVINSFVINALDNKKGTLEVNAPTGTTFPTFFFGTGSKVQIVRAAIYRTINLYPNGVISCDAYNSSTGLGGVIPLIASDKLNFLGGRIDASGKGYPLESQTLGIPGLGIPHPIKGAVMGGYSYGPEPNALLPIAGGSPAPAGLVLANNGIYCTPNTNADANVDFVPSGALPVAPNNYGYGADNAFGAGNVGSSSTSAHIAGWKPSTSIKWNTLVMGESGDPGFDAGDGAGGGGYGGDGRFNGLTPNLLGKPGGDGGDGGAPANGSRGGGIIILKMRTYAVASNIPSTFKMVLANGQSGQNGTNGAKGGDGGEGGLGSEGDCVFPKIQRPAGVGGYGESGKGAQGGDGGDGAQGGTVWVMKKTTGTSLANNVMAAGGYPGPGGSGGYSKKYKTLPIANNYIGGAGISTLSCNIKSYTLCQKPCFEYNLCDPDEVFLHIADMASGFATSTSTLPWAMTGSGSLQPLYYTDNDNGYPVNLLYFYKTDPNTGCPIKVKCMMYDNNAFKILIEKMFKVKDLETFVPATTGGALNVGITDANYDPIKNIVYMYNGNHLVSWYDLAANTWHDEDDPKKALVYAWNCFFYTPAPTTVGSGGGGGGGPIEEPKSIEPEVTYETTGDQGGNGSAGNAGAVEEEDNAPFIRPKDDGDIIYGVPTKDMNVGAKVDIKILQNNTDNSGKFTITIHNDVVLKVDITVYDIGGKLIYEAKQVTDGYQSQTLARGVYVVKINYGSQTHTQKIML